MRKQKQKTKTRTGKWDRSKRAQRIRAISPFGDYDSDGVRNARDCQPFNAMEHGLWGDVTSWVSSNVIAPVYQQVYKPYVAPQVQRVSEGISTVTTKAQQYVEERVPTPSYETVVTEAGKVVVSTKKKVSSVKTAVKQQVQTKGYTIVKIVSDKTYGGRIANQVINKVPVLVPVVKEKVSDAKTFIGLPAREQKKVVVKELGEYQQKEAEYIEKGWIAPVHPDTRRIADMGVITGISKQTGFLTPSPQLPMEFVGSQEYRTQVTKVKAMGAAIAPHLKDDAYTSPSVTAFYDKWGGQIKDEYFMGSEAEFKQFQREGDVAISAEKATVHAYNTAIDDLNAMMTTRDLRYDALTKEYTEYKSAEKEHERLHGLSIFGKYDRAEMKAASMTSKVFTDKMIHRPDVLFKMKDIPVVGAATHAYLLSKATPEYKASQCVSGIVESQYEELKTKPLKYGAMTAVFTALPASLKAGGWALRAARITPTIAKIPYIGKPVIKYTVPVVGGALMSGYVGSKGLEIHKAPTPYEKGRIIGATVLELECMAAGTYMGVKIPGMFGGSLRGAKTRLTRTKVPPESIIAPEIIAGKAQFPSLRGTERQLIKRFKTSEKDYGLPGEQYGDGIKVWRAAGEEYGAETTVGRGDYSFPSMYVSPEASPYFWRVKPDVKWSLFGIEPATPVPAPASAAYRLAIKDIIKIPKGVQRTDIYAPRVGKTQIFPSEASWALGRGIPGRGYITPEYIHGKGEAEAGIAVTTGLQRTGSQFYTTWKGKAIPIEEMSWFKTGLPRMSIGFEKGRYYVRRPRGTAIISTKKGIILHKGEQGEGYILPGGETETAAVRALERGISGKAETALEGTMREVYEELGLKTIKSKYLFETPGKDLSLYSKGRQHWWSKNVHTVFEIKTRGRVKPQTHEVKDLIYYKPGMNVKLSKDTEAILGKYYKTHTERTFKDVTGISKHIRELSKGKPLKNIITQRDILAEERYIRGTHKRGFISPLSLGVEYGIGRIAGVRYGGKYGLPRYKYSGYEPSLLKYTPVDYGKTSYERKGRKYKTEKYKEPYYPKYRLPKYIEPYYPRTQKGYYPAEGYVKPYPRKYKDPFYIEEPYTAQYKKRYPIEETTFYPADYPPYIPLFVPPPIIPKKSKTKKVKHKKAIRRKEKAWYEKHFIPDIDDLMRVPKGKKVKTPKMPKMPKLQIPNF